MRLPLLSSDIRDIAANSIFLGFEALIENLEVVILKTKGTRILAAETCSQPSTDTVPSRYRFEDLISKCLERET